MMNLRTLPLLVLLAFSLVSTTSAQDHPIASLQEWLDGDQQTPMDQQTWASASLTESQAAKATDMLWANYQQRLKETREQEWKDKLIELGDRKMKFEYKIFGKPKASGRSLFISMHGGGNAPAHVNEKQWKNQIGLYQPKEGLYLAPRAPTDTWNLWHQAHIDQFFQRIIQDAVAFEGVDPNRVYFMGYSAGGDGVYQLAPRMADRLAAAAMMAGHPNDASPLGLRNIGFALFMGGKDSAYNRNKIAAEWKVKLADLQESDPDGYQHEVTIYKNNGHWMDRKDAVGVPWMSKFTRNPLPKKVVWFQSGVTHQQFYWLAVDGENTKAKSTVVAELDGQNVNVVESNMINQLLIRLNDKMIDLDKPVSVQIGADQDATTMDHDVKRQIKTLYKTLNERGDRNYMFSAELSVPLNTDK